MSPSCLRKQIDALAVPSWLTRLFILYLEALDAGLCCNDNENNGWKKENYENRLDNDKDNSITIIIRSGVSRCIYAGYGSKKVTTDFVIPGVEIYISFYGGDDLFTLDLIFFFIFR